MSQLQSLINSFSNESTTEYRTTQFDISDDKTSLTAELSTLQLLFAPQMLWVRNSGGKRRLFTLCDVDKDASGEDIYGYHYQSEVPNKPTLNMLLIND